MSRRWQVADEWWALDFGCAGGQLRPARTHVQRHAGALLDNPGVWILVAGGAPLVSLPADSADSLVERAKAWSTADVMDAAHLERELTVHGPRPVTKLVGPAFIGYGAADGLDLSDARRAQPCSSPEAIQRLRAACSAEEWEHGGSEPHPERTFGVLDDAGELVALSGYEVWSDSIAHISIVTHPQKRGHGAGRAAVALAAQHALDAGLVPQYRTLERNTPSLRIAERLGFAKYGSSMYVRLAASAAARPID